MTNGNDVTHNTKHTILFNKKKFTPYSVPPAHAPASVPEPQAHTNYVISNNFLTIKNGVIFFSLE